MKILVCGGRDYRDGDRVRQALDCAHHAKPITLLIHGDCAGADILAKEWAISKGIQHKPYPYPRGSGRAGGPIRNQRMLDEGRPDGVIAFPGNRGTLDMTSRAERAGVPVWRPWR